MPPRLLDLLKDIHKKLAPDLKISSIKAKNRYAQTLYHFITNYYDEKGHTQKYAHKIAKMPGLKNNPTIELLIQMGKQSDTEAAKTPEQKQREYDEYMKKLDRHIQEGYKKIEEWNKIIRKLKAI